MSVQHYLRYRTPILCLLFILVSGASVIAQDTPGTAEPPQSEMTPPPEISFSPQPGEYGEAIRVRLRASHSDNSPRGLERAGTLWYRFSEDHDQRFLRVRGPLLLNGIPEARTRYTVEVRYGRDEPTESSRASATAEYVVDREAPPAPTPAPNPGVYPSGVHVELHSSGDAEIRYVLANRGGDERSYEEPVALNASSGQRSEHTLLAYAVDSVGNRSEVVEASYVVDSGRESGEPRLSVVSPVPGSFANRQLLLIESNALSGIRYTLDGGDPLNRGRAYTGPVVLSRTGAYTLRVAAQDPSGNVLRRRVVVNAGDADAIAGDQGVITTSREIRAPEGEAYFTTDGSAPSREDSRFRDSLPISPSAGVARTLVLRILVPESAAMDGSSGLPSGEYRYVYVLEGRRPATPQLFTYRLPAEPDPDVDDPAAAAQTRRGIRIALLSSPGAVIRYSLDGTSPVNGTRYDAPFVHSLPKDRNSGELTLRAIAVYSGTARSEELTQAISFDTAAPAPPTTMYDGASHVAQARIDVSAQDAAGSEDLELLYRLEEADEADAADEADRDARWASLGSRRSIRIVAPSGGDRRVRLRFVLRDAAGNRSPAGETLSLRLDGKPPQSPRIAMQDGLLRIEGDNAAYRVRRIHPAEENAGDRSGAEFTDYDGPLALESVPGRRAVYAVHAYTRDEVGNRSELVEREVSLDRRPLNLPANIGVDDGAVYAGAVTLRAPKLEPDASIRYAVRFRDAGSEDSPGDTPIEDPPTPPADQVLGEGLRLDAPEGAERHYRIALQPVFESSKRRGEITILSFVIDRRPPTPPQVSGIEDGGVYASARRFSVVPAESGDRVSYRLVPLPSDSAASDARWYELEARDTGRFIRVDVPPGKEQGFALRVRSVDAAGNTAERQAPLRFRIDRRPPDAPKLELDGATQATNGAYLSSEPVTLRISDVDQRRFYRIHRERLTDDGSSPRTRPVETATTVFEEGQEYQGPIRLEPAEGRMVRYRVHAVLVDEAGNVGPMSQTIVVDLDAERPSPPSIVSVHTNEGGQGGTVVFNHEADSRVVYRVVGSNGNTSPAREAQRIGAWRLPEGVTEGTLEYFARDEAGNRSTRRSVAVRGFSAASRPRLSGVEDGDVYGERVVLENQTRTDTVRYEVSSNGGAPPAVSRLSPVMPATVPFDVAPGETIRYRLAARSFTEGARPSPTVSYTFTIDRGAPEPPTLVDLRDGDFVTEDVRLRFEETENRVFFRVVDTSQGSQEDKFARYNQPFPLEATPGGVVRYRVYAYSVDPAGNRSEETQTWDLFLGEEIVYVSNKGGAEAPGTAQDPVGSLARALSIARQEGKRTIFVSAGDYTLQERVTVDGSLSIQGGFEAGEWRRSADARSTLRFEGGETERGPLVGVRNGKLTVGRIDVVTDVPHYPAIIELHDTSAFLQDVSFRTLIAAVVSQNGGDVTLKDVTVDHGAAGSGQVRGQRRTDGPDALINVNGGRAVFDGVRFRSTAEEPSVVIRGNSAQLFLRNGTISPGGGRRSLAVAGHDSRVVIESSRISAGRGERSARAIELDGGELLLRKSELRSEPGSRVVSGLSAVNADVRVEAAIFELSGGTGVAGISIQGGSALISGSAFQAAEVGSGFIHFMVLRGTQADVVANTVSAQGAGEVLVLRVVDSAVRAVNNTAVSSAVTGAAFAVNASGSSSLLLQNMLFSHDGSGRSWALFAADEQPEFRVETSSFAGWSTVFERSGSAFGGGQGRRTRSVEDLNGRDAFGGLAGSGNILGSAPRDLATGESAVPAEAVELDGRAAIPILGEASAEVDAGSPPDEDLPHRGIDIQGDARPAPETGSFDIGADEYVDSGD